jgi:leader peptidase (prepilin peptidase)/N-methyltransferase
MLRDDPPEIAVIAAFLALLGAATVVDLRERRIPNALTYPSTLVALALSAVTGVIVEAALGMLVAGGVMAALWLVGGGRLGLGDVKLSALCGAMLGVQGAQVYLVAGVAVGALVALIALLILRDRRATLPYGPPLVAGAVIAVALRGVLIAF